jgi:hypothetical protein
MLRRWDDGLFEGGDRDEEENDDDDDDEEDESVDSIESEEEEEEEDNVIAHNFIRTVSNGYYNQEFDDALSSDRSISTLTNWANGARPTQASYNKPDNWIDRNRIGLEKVKEQIQNCIDSVSHDQSVDLMLTHIV